MEYGNLKTREDDERRRELLMTLESCSHDDESAVAHERADKALLRFINDELVRDAFHKIKKHYI